MILDIALMLALAVWLLELGERGALTPEFTAFALLSLALLLAATRAVKHTWVRKFLEVAVSIAIFAAFVVYMSDGNFDNLGATLGPLSRLLLFVFAVYAGFRVIFRGFGKSGDK